MKVRYQAIAPLLAGEGSRAFLGLEINEAQKARPIVLIWAPEESVTDETLKERLLRETQRAANLQHPNIIRVYGLAAMEEGLARIVEFADGESLRKILEVTKTLPPDYASLVAAEAASGVHFAHLTVDEVGAPWVHGDIRPETVMVSFNGAVKVTGYGALAMAPKELYGKRTPGRRQHSAPEQVLAGRHMSTVETDVYLLGVLLYECLTGQVPFSAEKDFDQAVVSQPLPHANYENIPLGLVEVIQKATAKKTQDRYPSALAFRQAVESAMGILPSTDELGRYIRSHFPEGEQTRAARRRAIDAAIAEFARQQWDQTEAAPAPTSADVKELVATEAGDRPSLAQLASVQEQVRAITSAAPAVPEVLGMPVEPPPEAPVAPPPPPSVKGPPPLPAQAPAPAPAPTHSPKPETAAPEPRAAQKSRWWIPAAVAASLAFGISGVGFGLMRRAEPTPTPKDPPSAPVATATPPATSPAPAATSTIAPDTATTTATAPPPAAPSSPTPAVGKSPPPTTVAAAGREKLSSTVPSAPISNEPGQILLKVDPPVDVTMDGEHLGKTPLDAPAPNGKHTLKLSNAELGISVTRTLNVVGKTKQEWSIGKGSVMVSAPDGATVILDGKTIGKAPVKEIPAYEGQHRIQVTLGKAKYSQPFALRPTETMYITVELAPQE
ncbi:MAG TPA: serine/threonine-protein kinase [Myxococcaceae bacterium]|jgi:serine/threonine-protein kinase